MTKSTLSNCGQLVSVVMPCYNEAPFLSESIQSILNQSYENFELIIIDDCSIDSSRKIISQFCDFRIKYFRNDTNKKIVYSLNRGLRQAQGNYIARMDADDISLPSRLEKQVDFLKSNKNIDICGTWARSFGADSQMKWIYPLKSNEIKLNMMFENSIAHPSVMFRSDVFSDIGSLYSDEYAYCEDYYLWSNKLLNLNFANIPDILLLKREYPTGPRSSYKEIQIQNARRLKQSILEKFEIKFTYEELNLHYKISEWDFKYKIEELFEVGRWFERLLIHFHEHQPDYLIPLRQLLNDRFYKLCYFFSCKQVPCWKAYNSFDSLNNKISLKKKALIFFRSMSISL